MMGLTPKAKKELQLRIAQLTDPKAFEKAQRKSLFGIGNTVRAEYRNRWAQVAYKRSPGRPSHRAAIKRSLRSLVRRVKQNVFRLTVGSSVKTNRLARIVNILNPGFKPFRAKNKVPGLKIREIMLIRAGTIAKQRYQDELELQLLKQANGRK